MTHIKRGVTKRARHKKVLKMAKGYRGRAKNCFRIAIEKVEKDTNIIANITAMRDEVGKANIHGALPNTWMITEAAYAPYLFDVTVAGKKTYLTKGTWELKNDFMAGPFVNYAIKDTKNNRYLIIEGFTYNPSKSKRDLVFELEAIIQSVKFIK